MLNKIKSLMGYSNVNEEYNSSDTIEVKREKTIDTESNTEVRVCDCCNETNIEIITSETFVVDENGNRQSLYSEPRVVMNNGGIYDEDIAICDNCFADCETDVHKQFVWMTGKMNSLYKEMVAKEECIKNNNLLIEQIKTEAEERMSQIVEESNGINSEIANLNNLLQLYSQEYENLEKQCYAQPQ